MNNKNKNKNRNKTNKQKKKKKKKKKIDEKLNKTAIPADERKDTLKEYEDYGTKSYILIDQLLSYDEQHMKINFNLDDDSPLKKTLNLHDIVIVPTSVSL